MRLFVLTILIFVLNVLAFAQNSPSIVYLAGDSTMAEKKADKRPETGWGEMLQQYLDTKKVKVENHAQNGRSTKSFISEGRWQAIVDKLKKGDYVFIEFGHNDQKSEDPTRYAAPQTDYRKNLIKFVTEVRAKKAFPVLLTPVMRRRFNEKDEFYDTHGKYPEAVKAVAKEYKVSLIDMHRLSETVIKNYGAQNSKKLFLILTAGENPNYPKGVDDNTHFSQSARKKWRKLLSRQSKSKKLV